MEIAECIQGLLYENDKVEIPGLGTLVCSYHSAVIHPTQHSFEPPYKAIKFETGFEDDDLLINAMMQKENLLKDAAAKKISLFVNGLKTKLQTETEVPLAEIGIFKLDIEKELHFIQNPSVNFLTSSYGLDSFISQPILRRKESEIKPTEKKGDEKQKQTEAVKIKEKGTIKEKGSIKPQETKSSAGYSILLWLIIVFIFVALTASYILLKSGILRELKLLK